MTNEPDLKEVLTGWHLPEGQDLLEPVEEMIRPALLAGYFGTSFTRLVSGLQYHLGGAQDTSELAERVGLSCCDRVLDTCCFIGGPALQLASTFGCRISGIDLDAHAIRAASRIAQVTGFTNLLDFEVADAGNLPFGNGTFTVVWNQCSLETNTAWLEEFNRVLKPNGRFAFTFQRKGKHDDRWTLRELTSLLQDLGYAVDHADDITERDIEIGWNALERKLWEREDVFEDALGSEWINRARLAFQKEVESMKNGDYGNARIVATKKTEPERLGPVSDMLRSHSQ